MWSRSRNVPPRPQSLRLESKPTPPWQPRMAGGPPEAMWHQIRAGQRGLGGLLTTDPAQLSEDGIQGCREKMERSADAGGSPRDAPGWAWPWKRLVELMSSSQDTGIGVRRGPRALHDGWGGARSRYGGSRP